MKIAANLTMLFTEAPPLERPALAKAAGFDGVEVLFPYDFSVERWRDALAWIPLALINTPAGDWAAGERGWAAVPGAEARFRDDFVQALHFAEGLGAEQIHVMSGNASGPEAEVTLCANLAWAAEQAGPIGLTIEPLNKIDMPGYFLNGYDQAARILRRLALPTVGLQADLWHLRRTGLGMATIWDRCGDLVRHVQIAGLTARAEPNAASFAEVRAMPGYDGWIAAEYIPAGLTEAGLDWLHMLRNSATLAD